MTSTRYTTVISHYKIREGALEPFLDLVGKHYPVLRELELATDTPPQYFVDDQRPDKPALVVEIFEWASATAVERAHTHPAISTMWEQMSDMFALDQENHREHFSVRRLEVRH
jgi:hypothetical protein